VRLLLPADLGLVGLLATRPFDLELAQPVERRLDPLLAFARGTLLCRPMAPIPRRRIGFELGAQPHDPRRGRRCQLAQPLAPTERTRPCRGPHLEPVLRQHIERHQTLVNPRRHSAGQQLVEHRSVAALHPATRRFRHRLLRQIPKQFAIVRHRPAPLTPVTPATQ
jgi:hypothetical protein